VEGRAGLEKELSTFRKSMDARALTFNPVFAGAAFVPKNITGPCDLGAVASLEALMCGSALLGRKADATDNNRKPIKTFMGVIVVEGVLSMRLTERVGDCDSCLNTSERRPLQSRDLVRKIRRIRTCHSSHIVAGS
jgi:hypothetical protein